MHRFSWTPNKTQKMKSSKHFWKRWFWMVWVTPLVMPKRYCQTSLPFALQMKSLSNVPHAQPNPEKRMSKNKKGRTSNLEFKGFWKISMKKPILSNTNGKVSLISTSRWSKSKSNFSKKCQIWCLNLNFATPNSKPPLSWKRLTTATNRSWLKLLHMTNKWTKCATSYRSCLTKRRVGWRPLMVKSKDNEIKKKVVCKYLFITAPKDNSSWKWKTFSTLSLQTMQSPGQLWTTLEISVPTKRFTCQKLSGSKVITAHIQLSSPYPTECVPRLWDTVVRVSLTVHTLFQWKSSQGRFKFTASNKMTSSTRFGSTTTTATSSPPSEKKTTLIQWSPSLLKKMRFLSGVRQK